MKSSHSSSVILLMVITCVLLCGASPPTWTLKLKKKLEGRYVSLDFSPDGRMLAGGELFRISVWRFTDQGDLALEATSKEGSAHVAFAADGKTLAAAILFGASSGVVLFDVANWTPTTTVRSKHCQHLGSLEFAPDGSLVVTGGAKRRRDPKTGWLFGDVTLWNPSKRSYKTIEAGHDSLVYCVCFAPDGKTVAAGDGHGKIKLWSVPALKQKAVLFAGEHGSGVGSLVFSPDGTILASGGSDEMIRLWDVASSKQKIVLTGHVTPDERDISGEIRSLAFSPDGKLLASGSTDATVRLWDVASGKEIAKFTCADWVWAVAFSPDGNLLAAAIGSYEATEELRIWERESQQKGTDDTARR